MPDSLSSRDALHLAFLWQRYDAAEGSERTELRQIIELHIIASVIRTVSADLDQIRRSAAP